MEQNQDQSLFDMNMDSTTQSHLNSISKWTKFISISVFIVCGLVLMLFAVYSSQLSYRFTEILALGDSSLGGVLFVIIAVVLLLVGLWMFFLFRASTLLKKGLQNRNTADLADGFKALKNYFVFSFVLSVLSLLSTLQTLF